MISVLVPIEEGRDPAWALSHVIELYRQEPIRIHLLNVRTPLPSYVARWIPAAERHGFHHENGVKAMREAVERLDRAGVPHRDHVLVGQKAQTIVEFARENHCSSIVIDKPATGLLEGLGLGSIGAQLHHLLRPGDACQIREGA